MQWLQLVEMGIKEKEEAEMNNKEEKVEKVVLSFINHADCQASYPTRRKKMMKRNSMTWWR